MKDSPARGYRSRQCPEDIRKWLEFNFDVNSNPAAELWLDRAFAFCREKLGIPDEPSKACSLVHAREAGEGVAGLVVSSDKRVLAVLEIAPGGTFGLDPLMTRTFQTIRPDLVVALLWECESLRFTELFPAEKKQHEIL